MVSFSNQSNYNRESGFRSIKFGSDAPLLEVELNELQEILQEQTHLLVDSLVSDNGFTKIVHSLLGNTLTISGIAYVDRTLVLVTPLTIEVTGDTPIYLKYRTVELTHESEVLKYGNLQTSIRLANTIKDNRLDEETSRRTQIVYDISNAVGSVDENPKFEYLSIGEVIAGEFIPNEVLDIGGGRELKAHVANATENIHVKRINIQDLSLTEDKTGLLVITTEEGEGVVAPSPESLNTLFEALGEAGLTAEIADKLLPFLQDNPHLLDNIIYDHRIVKATTSVSGHVKVDGKTIVSNSDGVISIASELLEKINSGTGSGGSTGDGGETPGEDVGGGDDPVVDPVDPPVDPPVDATIYGVSIDLSTATPTVTYIEDAETFTPADFVILQGRRVYRGNGWDNRFPFNAIRPCVLDSSTGEVLQYLNPSNFQKPVGGGDSLLAEDSADYYDVAIEFPLMYWKIERNGNTIDVRYSDVKVDDTWVAHAHTDREGKVRSMLYLGAYLTSLMREGLNSVPNINAFSTENYTPLSPFASYGDVSMTEEVAVVLGDSYNINYGIMTYSQLTMLQILFLTLFKTSDSSVLGTGYSTYNSIAPGIGETYSGGLIQGTPTPDGEDFNSSPTVFLGLEHLIGGYYNYVGGLSSTVEGKLILDPTDSQLMSIETDLVKGSGFIKDVIGDSNFGFFPKAFGDGATSSTYFCDEGYTDVPFSEAVLVGGDGCDYADVGIFNTALHYRDTPVGSEVGVRFNMFGGEVIE